MQVCTGLESSTVQIHDTMHVNLDILQPPQAADRPLGLSIEAACFPIYPGQAMQRGAAQPHSHAEPRGGSGPPAPSC